MANRFVGEMFCSQVYGVATFYHFFNLKPQGKHTCVVYLGTAALHQRGRRYREGHPGSQYSVGQGRT
jgi:bidirectional [NiFe] hydrogenase diaphorase subunit